MVGFKSILECFRPNGATYVSLGQRPRLSFLINLLALKGRPKSEVVRDGFRAPFQGLNRVLMTIPSALPWADIDHPVGVGYVLNLKQRRIAL